MTQPYGPIPDPPATPSSGGTSPPYGSGSGYPPTEPSAYGAPGTGYAPTQPPPYGASGSGYPASVSGVHTTPTPTSALFYSTTAPVPAPTRTAWPLVAGLLFVGGCLLGTLTGYIVGQLPGRASATPVPAVSRTTPTARPVALGRPASVPTALAQATALAQKATRVYGPAVGQLDVTSDTEVASKRTTVQLRDFIVEATFTNPYDPGDYGWDYGFFFRHNGTNHEYRIYVTSDGDWSLKRVANGESGTDTGDATATPTVEFTPIDGGNVDNLNRDTGATNRLRLVASGDGGLFFVNDQYVAAFELSDYLDKGEIELGSAFLLDNTNVGESVHYSDLTIWALQP